MQERGKKTSEVMTVISSIVTKLSRSSFYPYKIDKKGTKSSRLMYSVYKNVL